MVWARMHSISTTLVCLPMYVQFNIGCMGKIEVRYMANTTNEIVSGEKCRYSVSC